MRVLITFTVERDGKEMRLVIDNRGAQNIEVRDVDALGDVSWRPASTRPSELTNEKIIGLALQHMATAWDAVTNGRAIESIQTTHIITCRNERTLLVELGKVGVS